MSNFRIMARNIAADASLSATPSLVAGLPVGNLVLPTERGQTARSTSTASQGISLTWAASVKANMVALTRHNLTTSSTLRSVLSNVTPATLIDTGALAGYSITGLDTDVDDYTDAGFLHLKNTVQYFTLQTAIRSLAMTVTDASNPDGFFDLNHLFVGKYFELFTNPGGLDYTPTDASSVGRADDGSVAVDAGWKGATVVVNLERIPEETDLATLLAISRYLGKGGECWIDPYPESATAKGIYSRGSYVLMDSPTFGAQYGNHRNTMRFEAT